MGHVVWIVGVVVLAYFAILNAHYVVFTAIAWRSVSGHLRARPYAAVDDHLASPLTPPVSVVLPAYNEMAGVVDSVRSLLALRYPRHEVIVVNDGSTDDTLALLVERFDLVPARRALRGELRYAEVRGTYVSRRHPDLWVIDKENGGKADALNCALDAARHPFVCAVDGDAVIEEDALLRVAKPMLDDPELVVATGGIVRIGNGCTIDHGRVVDVALPSSRLAAIQVVEYFRAFLVGRVGWSRLDSLLIISGAFGLFRRSLVAAVGGYASDTVGEDAELVVRIHRHCRENGIPYRVAFVPDPVCWTEAPEDLTTLARQRRRWQRGLAETLWRHRRVAFNPRYGAFGTLAVPYFILFEALGPLIELAGYVTLPIAWALGLVPLAFLVLFAMLALGLGVLLSVSALALEEFSFRRHPRGREIVRMMGLAVAENLGYRQLTVLWRVQGLFEFLRGHSGWGTMERRGMGRGRGAPAAVRLASAQAAATTHDDTGTPPAAS